MFSLQEQFQVRNHKDHLSDLTVSHTINQLATCGDNRFVLQFVYCVCVCVCVCVLCVCVCICMCVCLYMYVCVLCVCMCACMCVCCLEMDL